MIHRHLLDTKYKQNPKQTELKKHFTFKGTNYVQVTKCLTQDTLARIIVISITQLVD